MDPAQALRDGAAAMAKLNTVTATLKFTKGAVTFQGFTLAGAKTSVRLPGDSDTTYTVKEQDLSLSIEVVITGGHVFVHVPFSTFQEVTGPDAAAIPDLAKLFDPATGLPAVIPAGDAPPNTSASTQAGGVSSYRVSATYTADQVHAMLPPAQLGRRRAGRRLDRRHRPPDPQGDARRRLRRRRQRELGRGRHRGLQLAGQHHLAVALARARPVSKSALLGLAGAGLFVAALDAYVVVTLLPAMTGDVGLSIDQLEKAAPIVTGFLAGYVIAMPLLGALLRRARTGAGLRGLHGRIRGRVGDHRDGRSLELRRAAVAGRRPVRPGPRRRRPGPALAGTGRRPLPRAGARRSPSARWQRCRRPAASSARSTAPRWHRPRPSLGGWRFVFWLNLPLAVLCGAGLVAALRHATPQPDAASSSVDWAGAALLGIGLGLLVLALYPDDPNHRAVNSYFVPAFAASLVCLAAYGWRQLRRLEPLIPRELLRSRLFAGALMANLLIGAALMVALVDVPILGRLVFKLDQLGSGLLLTQFLAGVPIGAIVGGVLAGRIGGGLTATVGVVLAAAAFLQMSGWTANELNLRLRPPAAGRRRARRVRSGFWARDRAGDGGGPVADP